MPDIEQQALTGPAPCDRCPMAQRCKVQLEACAAFGSYVAGESEKRWRAAKREPTHERFDELLVYQSRAARLARQLRPEKHARSEARA